jgi:hypothetical protein
VRAVLAAMTTTLLPAAAGYFVVSGPRLGRLALGSVVGIAAMGIGATAGALIGHGLLLPGAVAGLIGLLIARPLGRPQLATSAALADRAALALVLAVGLVLAGASFFRPVPSGDAWTIWSLKASSIFSTGNLSGSVFTSHSYVFSHQDYPPILPAWQALAFTVEGGRVPAWPTEFQLAWLWGSAAVALLYLFRGRPAIVPLLVAAWACSPAILNIALSGAADMASAMFLMVGTALLIETKAWVAGAAIVLAACALTKTEGTVEVLAVLISVAAYQWRQNRSPLAPLPFRPLVVVALLVVATSGTWSAVVRSRGVSSDSLSGSLISHISVAQLPSRVEETWHYMFEQGIDPALWGLVVGLTVLCLARRPVHWGLLAAAGLTYAVMTLVYVATPYQLSSDLRFSVDRILAAPLGLLVLAGVWAVSHSSGARVEPASEDLPMIVPARSDNQATEGPMPDRPSPG